MYLSYSKCYGKYTLNIRQRSHAVEIDEFLLEHILVQEILASPSSSSTLR